MPERWDRRDFLKLGPIRPPAHVVRLPAGHPVVCLTKPAMACLFELQYPDGSIARRDAMSAFDWIESIEERISVYRPTSAVSRVNAMAGDGPVEMDAELFELLADCQRLWAETAGAFDVTAGPLIEVWGFKSRQGRWPSESALSEARSRVGMEHVRLDPRRRTIEFARPGMEINFGAIGKGYALDRIADHLERKGASSFLIGAGQSSLRAVGSCPGDEGWWVDLADPHDRSRRLGKIRLRDAGLSTSGSAEQFFEYAGKRYGHVLDPRSGRPVEGVAMVAVVAPSAAQAEGLSTAFFVMGPGWAADYAERHGDVGAVLVSADGELMLMGNHHFVPVGVDQNGERT
jgi:thiamine biosynthesis lipoprotein